jgi:hypothetical protein
MPGGSTHFFMLAVTATSAARVSTPSSGIVDESKLWEFDFAIPDGFGAFACVTGWQLIGRSYGTQALLP